MIPHRIRQFARAGIPPCDEDYVLARSVLSPGLLALFETQHPRDIVHSADTARWLIERGHEDPELLAAALLHDIGKGQQRRQDRAAWVVASWVRLSDVAADERSRFEVRRAMQRTRDHSLAGAEMLRSAGASARVVELTLHHHQPSAGDPMLALLQQADAAS